MMEGKAAQFEGKSLGQIEIDLTPLFNRKDILLNAVDSQIEENIEPNKDAKSQ